mmetsp:Transcript_36947/g.80214  ORF Transcript_36947/g.80214 Transcript_36947/m.80214 type:complete len:341 (-) Transcript_36947:142-1164(-)
MNLSALAPAPAPTPAPPSTPAPAAAKGEAGKKRNAEGSAPAASAAKKSKTSEASGSCAPGAAAAPPPQAATTASAPAAPVALVSSKKSGGAAAGKLLGQKADTSSGAKAEAKGGAAGAAKPQAKEKLSKAQMEAKILGYMQMQNRPYNVQNVFDNLHAAVPKSQVQVIMDAFAASGEIMVKEYGKLKVYLVAQSKASSTEAERESQELEKEVKEAEGKNKEVKSQLEQSKQASSALRRDREVLVAKLTVEREVRELTSRLEKLQAAAEESGEQVDLATVGAVESECITLHREWKRRRRLCMEVLHTLSERADMKVDRLVDRYGIETDDYVGQTFPEDMAV